MFFFIFVKTINDLKVFAGGLQNIGPRASCCRSLVNKVGYPEESDMLGSTVGTMVRQKQNIKERKKIEHY